MIRDRFLADGAYRNRATFANTMVATMEKYGFDGEFRSSYVVDPS